MFYFVALFIVRLLYPIILDPRGDSFTSAKFRVFGQILEAVSVSMTER